MAAVKLEVLIPSWPAARSLVEKYGARDYGGIGSSDSTRISFRAINPKDSYIGDACRTYQDIGIYVWFDKDSSFMVELKLMDIHSMSVYEAEQRIKLLKSMVKKVTKAGVRLGDFYHGVTESGVLSLLLQVCTALGIKRTVQYHGIGVKETYTSVFDVLQYVVDDVIARRAKLKSF